MGTAARSRLLAVLRTLGLRPGQTRALAAWELGPVLATSLVVGAVLGLVVPWVLVRAVDLTGLTGGRSQPPLAVDPLVVGAVLAAVALTVLTAVTVSAWLAGRTNLAQALRVGEDS
ncbi:FtsX-like permease family protein [Ornithinimicrobium kibberense]